MSPSNRYRQAALVVSAINLSTQASRTTVADIRRRLLPALLKTAAEIERDLALGRSPT